MLNIISVLLIRLLKSFLVSFQLCFQFNLLSNQIHLEFIRLILVGENSIDLLTFFNLRKIRPFDIKLWQTRDQSYSLGDDDVFDDDEDDQTELERQEIELLMRQEEETRKRILKYRRLSINS